MPHSALQGNLIAENDIRCRIHALLPNTMQSSRVQNRAAETSVVVCYQATFALLQYPSGVIAREI